MNTRHGGHAVLAILLVLLAEAGRAGNQQPQPAGFKAGVELVTVDLTVLSRGGEPVVDLTVPDVTVTVDGRPRPLVSLRLIRADASGVSASTSPHSEAQTPRPPVAPLDPGRRFVLVVDRDQITRGEGQQMLAAGARFIERLPPSDRVAVWAIPASGARLQFTSDRDTLRRQLRLMVGTQPPPFGRWVVARDEAIAIDDGATDVLRAVIGRECLGQPQGCPSEVEAQARTLARETRDRATITLMDIEGLIDALGTIEGPKHVVWVTGGPPLLREFRTGISGLGAKAAAARVTVHALQVLIPSYQARTDSLRAMPMEVDQTESAAYALAGTTGGLAITPASGDIAFTRLARELSASYLLAFEADASDRDGKLHAIEVVVADRGWGVSVRARKSFRIDQAAPESAPHGTQSPRPAGESAPALLDASAGLDGPLGTDVPSLLTRLADYVERFEQGLSAVVAEERYVQVVHPWRGNPKGPDVEPSLKWFDRPGDPGLKQGGPIISRRQLLSDLLLVQAGGTHWTGYRDVAEVDGRLVRDRTERVRELFLSTTPDRDAQFQRINAESARYNLGDFRRTLNVPTVTLSFMRRPDQWRFEFKRVADEKVEGRACRVLAFKEKARPTLIGTPGGTEIPIEGRIWIDAETGQVVRTELRFDRGVEKRSLIRADFGPLPSVAVLVPTLMWEWYEGANQLGRIGGDKPLVQCVATYSNYRRFQVSTREQIR